MAIWGDEFRRCLTVEVRNQTGEILGKAQNDKYADQLVVVRGGEGTFEVKAAKNNILLVRVIALHTRTEVSDRSRT